MKMKARQKLANLEYDPACWIDDFLAALFNWQMQAREIGETITDEELSDKPPQPWEDRVGIKEIKREKEVS